MLNFETLGCSFYLPWWQNSQGASCTVKSLLLIVHHMFSLYHIAHDVNLINYHTTKRTNDTRRKFRFIKYFKGFFCHNNHFISFSWHFQMSQYFFLFWQFSLYLSIVDCPNWKNYELIYVQLSFNFIQNVKIYILCRFEVFTF